MAAKFYPSPNVGSQIERAVLALLQDAYADYATDKGVNFYFSNDWKLRADPCVTVLAHHSTETVPHTGIETYSVIIEWKWKGNNVAGETNPDTNWQSINEFVGIGIAALSQTAGNSGAPDTLPATVAAEITRLGRLLATNDPANQADMANFTCEYVEYKGAKRAEIDHAGNFLILETRNFEIRAVPANVD